MKAALILAIVSLAAILVFPSDVAAKEPGRVVIVAGEGVDPVELIGTQRRRGNAVGLASVRSGARSDQRMASQAAVATMLRGIRSTRLAGSTPDLVAEAARTGAPLVVVRGPGSVAVPGAIDEATAESWDQDRLGRAIEGAMRRSRFVLVLLGPTTVEGMQEAVTLTSRSTRVGDTVLALSVVPTEEDFSDRLWLGAVTINEGPGVLFSDTTGIPGVVSLLDVAPTVARALGIDEPSSDGHAVQVTSKSVDLGSMATRFRHSTRVRHPLTRGTIWAAMVGLTAAALMLGRSLKRSARFIAGGLLAAPVALIVEPLSGARSITASAVFVAAIAILGGAAVSFRPMGSTLVIALTTLAVVMGDLLAGGPLSRFSVLSYSPIQGDRFHGIGNELMGVVIGSVLIVAARTPQKRRTWVMVVMAGVTAIMAAPALGAKLGAVLTCMPTFLAASVATQRRLNLKTWLAIAGFTAAATLLIAAISRVSGSPGHVGEAAGGGTELVDVFLRKAGAAARILRFSIWPRALAGIVVICLFARRFVPAVGAALTNPAVRASAYGAAVAIVAALAFNDAGAIAGMLVAMLCAAALFATSSETEPRST